MTKKLFSPHESGIEGPRYIKRKNKAISNHEAVEHLNNMYEILSDIYKDFELGDRFEDRIEKVLRRAEGLS